MFKPRGVIGVIGVMLFLVALYLVLELAGGASQVFGALASFGTAIFGTLQGRTVKTGGTTVTGGPASAQLAA